MPTLESVTTHQLAALIAVEREAAERYRKATASVYRQLAMDCTDSPEYRAASAEEDAAMRAMVTAQIEVDQALSALGSDRNIAVAAWVANALPEVSA